VHHCSTHQRSRHDIITNPAVRPLRLRRRPARERCGAGTAGGGPASCDNNLVDPIFKFDRRTGAVLANFGRGIMQTPHGIHVDTQGNVWITDFAGNEAGTKGHRSTTKGPQARC
jgi:hypothetical protein